MSAPTSTASTTAPTGTAMGVACIFGSCIALQLGAALAVQLFPHAGSWATASLRLLIAAVILVLVTRPKFRTWTRKQWWAIITFGLSMGFMNGCFYTGIERIPLGTAVTIEFLGPLTLAAVLSRTARDIVCVVLALAGMVLLGINSYNGHPLDPVGVGFVLAAGFSGRCTFWRRNAQAALSPARAGSRSR
ncbi:hypothetical protein HMPREF0291_10183 [Corynebacterium genitalium ATCC 33030]|uniref:EamA domain-containing protein n=1 Tax=Corynebacterium genitalium ATCC 33030 TaxID=585529 RepID=D7WAP4_9CORY|nr:hypothetical protein HMPREF0291_10183 [Corynebacterium genitalium ATCC 33030]